ncbi:Homeodomain-like DNA binding domain-containing transcription factor [Mucor lusitanicus CBS 277.49]|uniref:Homeodomain-like DNA binding domain-containing transcription factor n=1 Tax=Mucor lusitanicus CBS 277.49 TaxID=747725 RepID=A0A168LZ90_MUCCL|nr:Homeodomain-like DNA binding domain-containing transcription factor [Mucor lusitanicus CBS 277.49]
MDELKKLPKHMLGKLSAKQASFPLLESQVLKFIRNMEHNNIAISPGAITEHAIELSKSNETLLGGKQMPEFSKGWVQRLMERHNLQKRTMCGKAGSVRVNNEGIQAQLTKIREAIKEYQLKDIYNMDESGLLYRNAPNRTISGNKISGVKMDKTRLTVGFFCNADGSDKYELIIIGKACKYGHQLVFEYYFNKKAWMTREMFVDVMYRFNSEMIKRKKKVLMLLDNAKVHEVDREFSNVKLMFLPPNTTSHCQPLDQGIIANFKANYRQLQYRHAGQQYRAKIKDADQDSNVVIRFDEVKELYGVNQVEAMNWIKVAWNKVKDVSIANCRRHSTLLQLRDDSHEAINSDDLDLVSDEIANVDIVDDIDKDIVEELENENLHEQFDSSENEQEQ